MLNFQGQLLMELAKSDSQGPEGIIRDAPKILEMIENWKEKLQSAIKDLPSTAAQT